MENFYSLCTFFALFKVLPVVTNCIGYIPIFYEFFVNSFSRKISWNWFHEKFSTFRQMCPRVAARGAKILESTTWDWVHMCFAAPGSKKLLWLMIFEPLFEMERQVYKTLSKCIKSTLKIYLKLRTFAKAGEIY